MLNESIDFASVPTVFDFFLTLRNSFYNTWAFFRSNISSITRQTYCEYSCHFAALHWLLITLSMLGQLCVTGGWETIYVWSAEIYPTVTRNVGMGTSSAFARVGSMIAPYIAKSVRVISISLWKSTSRQRSGKCAIRKRLPLQKPRWEKTKLTIRYLYHENIS